jgi:hypothetical protein
VRSAQGENVWSTFAQRFQALTVARNKPRPFVVSEELPGQWTFSPEFQVRPRFDDLARDAGNRLGVSEDVDALDFWLDRLSYYLWRYANCEGLQIVTVGGENRRLIKDVLRSSYTFSTWLSQSPKHMLDIVLMHSATPLPWNTIREPDKHLGQQEGSNEGGEAWAAEENRKQETRRCIVQALRELEFPQDGWPAR